MIMTFNRWQVKQATELLFTQRQLVSILGHPALMTNFVYISQMIRGLASRKVQLAEVLWRYKALQVNLDHAHTALPDQTSPRSAAHQRYLACCLHSPVLAARCNTCAPYVEVVARITSSEYHLSKQAKLILFLLCRRLSSLEHLSPPAAWCTLRRPVHNF